MTHLYYTLDQFGNPQEAQNYEQWEAWYLTADRDVDRSVIGDSQVSTLFLAFRTSPEDPLWETYVDGGPLNGLKDRCNGARADAEAMHARVVERVTTENGGGHLGI